MGVMGLFSVWPCLWTCNRVKVLMTVGPSLSIGWALYRLGDSRNESTSLAFSMSASRACGRQPTTAYSGRGADIVMQSSS